MRQVQAQLAAHGTTWLASEQTAGRGQRGRQWQSQPGENLSMSTIISPRGLSISQQFLLSAMTALACHDFFSKHAKEHTHIKWPNDIYWRDRKAGGVLIDNLIQGQEWRYAVVGIGININQVNFSGLPNPVSLKQVTGKHLEVVESARQLCNCLEQRWQQLVAQQYEVLLAEYNAVLYKKNEVVKLKKEDAILSAKVVGVNGQGELLVDIPHREHLAFGSVEWLLD